MKMKMTTVPQKKKNATRTREQKLCDGLMVIWNEAQWKIEIGISTYSRVSRFIP
jgi:hypothetical protein